MHLVWCSRRKRPTKAVKVKGCFRLRFGWMHLGSPFGLVQIPTRLWLSWKGRSMPWESWDWKTSLDGCSRQLTNPVLWEDSMKAVIREGVKEFWTQKSLKSHHFDVFWATLRLLSITSISTPKGGQNPGKLISFRFYECGPMKQIKAMMKRIDPAVSWLQKHFRFQTILE